MFATEETFGQRLRRERERRQISLSSIAANTKIGIGLLQGLERDDVSRWPSGIFRRSFIRAYAEATGLDPAATTREFLELFPDPSDDFVASESPPDLSKASGLRLTLAENSDGSSIQHALRNIEDRWRAGAFDAIIVVLIGVCGFLTLGAFWLSLAIGALGYHAAAVLLVGTTPGAYLFSIPVSHFSKSVGPSFSSGVRFDWIDDDVPLLGETRVR